MDLFDRRDEKEVLRYVAKSGYTIGKEKEDKDEVYDTHIVCDYAKQDKPLIFWKRIEINKIDGEFAAITYILYLTYQVDEFKDGLRENGYYQSDGESDRKNIGEIWLKEDSPVGVAITSEVIEWKGDKYLRYALYIMDDDLYRKKTNRPLTTPSTKPSEPRRSSVIKFRAKNTYTSDLEKGVWTKWELKNTDVNILVVRDTVKNTITTYGKRQQHWSVLARRPINSDSHPEYQGWEYECVDNDNVKCKAHIIYAVRDLSTEYSYLVITYDTYRLRFEMLLE